VCLFCRIRFLPNLRRVLQEFRTRFRYLVPTNGRSGGAALLTKYPIYKEGVQLERTFGKYAIEHYDSWVVFGHPDDIKPVLDADDKGFRDVLFE